MENEEFFRKLVRGGTIRAVSAALRFSMDSCYRWRREVHVSPRVPGPVIHSGG